MIKKIISLTSQMVSNPTEVAYHALGKMSPSCLQKKYIRRCHKNGVNGLKFILSFDCDTEEDFNVAWDVHSRLIDMGIMPVYAVPGELLIRGEKVYQRIKDTGAEFINHGYTEHTYFNEETGLNASCFFYDTLSEEMVRNDIRNGDKCLRDVLGVVPQGFRTPHFGTYSKPEHLKVLYSELENLNYTFSSSTPPIFGYCKGPAHKVGGIIEFPVTSTGSRPLSILDSWAFLAKDNPHRQQGRYLLETKLKAAEFETANIGLINIYADPSHVAGQREFFEAVAIWSKIAENTNYSTLIGEL